MSLGWGGHLPAQANLEGLQKLYTHYGPEARSYERELRERLAAGFDINEKSETGFTELMVAALMGDVVKVRILLKYKADPRITGYKDATPLHLAVYTKNPDMITLLVAHGADPNAVDDNGTSILSYAIQYSNLAFVQKLVEKGADLHRPHRRLP
ncbi:MAG: ankyrin repeat domain-containing protein [Candidatus Sericytochromatia bacterium]